VSGPPNTSVRAALLHTAFTLDEGASRFAGTGGECGLAVARHGQSPSGDSRWAEYLASAVEDAV